jgi:hypothetical protein
MDGKLMVKIISLLAFMGIYFSAFGQKASYYTDPAANLNTYQWFYMPNSSLDAHAITNPFLDKKSLNDLDNLYFILYNELSLKNLTILDGNGPEGTLEAYIYEGSNFANQLTPLGYKTRKIKGRYLIIDFLNASNHVLVWRGWLDLKKMKGTLYQQYQKAITLILTNLKIEPVIPG